MLVMDDSGIARLETRYADKEDWLVEVTEKHVSLYEVIGKTKCLEQRWERVDDVKKYVSMIK